MKLLVYYDSISPAKRRGHVVGRVFNNIEKECRRLGYDVHTSIQNKEYDVIWMWGGGDEPPHFACIKGPRLKLDSGLFSMHIRHATNQPQLDYFRVGLNSPTGIGEFFAHDMPSERWDYLSQKYNIKPGTPKTTLDGPILVFLQSPRGWQYKEDIPIDQWYADKVREIRSLTDREIRIRTHPNDDEHLVRKLMMDVPNLTFSTGDKTRMNALEEIRTASAAFSNSSSALMEAYLEGIPTFSGSPRCIIHEAAEKDFTNLNTPELIDWSKRPQFLQDWAYTTWHADEIARAVEYYTQKTFQLYK